MTTATNTLQNTAITITITTTIVMIIMEANTVALAMGQLIDLVVEVVKKMNQ